MNKKVLNDIFLILSICVLVIMIVFINEFDTGSNVTAEIWRGDTLLDTIDLDSSGVIDYDFGEEKIVVKHEDGQIWVESSTCHNKTCVNTGKTSSPLKPILCMDLNFRIIIKNSDLKVDVVVG